MAAGFTPAAPAQERPVPPPANAGFDYQIGGDYPLPKGATVVSRDWFEGHAAGPPAYSICYVNAFQTQDDEAGRAAPGRALAVAAGPRAG